MGLSEKNIHLRGIARHRVDTGLSSATLARLAEIHARTLQKAEQYGSSEINVKGVRPDIFSKIVLALNAQRSANGLPPLDTSKVLAEYRRPKGDRGLTS
jgi:uncharacterized protein YkwD